MMLTDPHDEVNGASKEQQTICIFLNLSQGRSRPLREEVSARSLKRSMHESSKESRPASSLDKIIGSSGAAVKILAPSSAQVSSIIYRLSPAYPAGSGYV